MAGVGGFHIRRIAVIGQVGRGQDLFLFARELEGRYGDILAEGVLQVGQVLVGEDLQPDGHRGVHRIEDGGEGLLIHLERGQAHRHDAARSPDKEHHRYAAARDGLGFTAAATQSGRNRAEQFAQQAAFLGIEQHFHGGDAIGHPRDHRHGVALFQLIGGVQLQGEVKGFRRIAGLGVHLDLGRRARGFIARLKGVVDRKGPGERFRVVLENDDVGDRANETFGKFDQGPFQQQRAAGVSVAHGYT
jgi:hypothetical protein